MQVRYQAALRPDSGYFNPCSCSRTARSSRLIAARSTPAPAAGGSLRAGSGVHDGDQIPGIVGYEMDGSTSATPLPDAIGGTYTILGASPYTDVGGPSQVANATIYQAPSGAWVFGAGTTSWPWGLDLDGAVDPRIQRITSNILDRFVGKTNQTTIEIWSGRRDLNSRPPAPHAGTLPGCATPRLC